MTAYKKKIKDGPGVVVVGAPANAIKNESEEEAEEDDAEEDDE
jgi:serine acetyltransferase